MSRVSFFVMLCAATSLLGVALLTKFVSSDHIIFDGEGGPVKAGVRYYARPIASSQYLYKEITLGYYNDTTSALRLAPSFRSIPLIFTPWPAKEDGSLNDAGDIYTSDNLTISFGENDLVAKDAIWFVEEDPIRGMPYVPVGPVEGSLDPKYFLFKIERVERFFHPTYQFVSSAFPNKSVHPTDFVWGWFTLSSGKNHLYWFNLERFEAPKLAKVC